MAAWDGYSQVAAGGRDYEQVAANATAQILGPVGAVGDTLDFVWAFPVTTTPGALSILDGAIVVWTMSGATLSSIQPFVIPMNIKSKTGALKITTGANMSAMGIGLFS